MAENFIFTMQDLRVVRSGREILKGIYLSFFPGAKIGVIGPNGSGKSTLLRIMAGVEKEFFGHARPDPSARIGFLPQEPKLDNTLNVRGNVELGVKPIRGLLDRFNAVSAEFSEPMSDVEMEKLLAEQAKLQDAIDAANGWELDRTLEVAMDALRLPPGEAEVANLSGGEKRRVALCRVLLEKPDLLLLDEPTNHLDAESVEWLEQHLKQFAGTVVAITHDRYFLDNVAQWILELDRGQGVPRRNLHSPRPQVGRLGGGVETSSKRLWRSSADRGSHLQATARRHRGGDRAQRRRQDHPVSDDCQTGKARRGRAASRRNGEARVRGSESGIASG